ncbi:family 20 glycosylhydrolase [Cellvibrio sp. NN19]|uniref:family 20 glycosylhydrolase n=1 Tax=Cellvibrio chitinivorans TaxID=3102792 RepID=UPI002B40FDDB|nr:family 20 glycosylhydrolase [Cellvibrio sp. NN19]WQA41855.1 beta-N-acetylhexosaminidase Hex20A [Cellvibrio sp. NN19]
MKSAGRPLFARLGALTLALGLAQSAFAANLSQQQLSEFAENAQLRFGVISNLGDKPKAHVILNNESDAALPAGAGDWKIYFHSVRKLDSTQVEGLSLRHVQGDLHELSPTASFKGLAKGASVQVPYTASASMVSFTDFMPRAFITQQGLTAEVFANTDTENIKDFVESFTKPEQLQRFADDRYPIATATSRYQDNLAVNKAAAKLDTAPQIIPTPAEVKYRKGTATIDNSWKISYSGRLTGEAKYLAGQLKAAGIELESKSSLPDATGGVVVSSAKTIELKVDPAIGEAESYSLNIAADNITIVGSDNAGAFYGIQSVLSLLPAQVAASHSVPQLSAKDAPRYRWRGMMYDMGRNFHGKDVTLRLIEQMARYKLNKLHLHLTEDEGWRLQIPGLPELTEVGAQRCFDLSETSCLLTQLGTGPHKSGSGNGFYTTDDFIEIVKFATARHIQVIPEIDMPGHARAAVKSMEARYKKLLKAGKKAEAEQYLLSDPQDKSQYLTVQNYTDNSINVCLPSTYAFVDKVVYELQQMYRKAGTKLVTFHMGGDETGAGSWTASPACNALFAKGEMGVAGPGDLKPYFVSKVAAITAMRGLDLAGWEDGLMYDATNTFNRSQFANKHVLANAWDNIWEWGVADRAYRLANAGYEPIISAATHLYFDHPHETNPEERGYYWAARYTDIGKVFGFMPDNLYANADKTRNGTPIDDLEALVGRAMPKLEKPENLRGIQGQVWSETIRTAAQLEQMIYPRLVPLAERAWHKAAWEGDRPDAAARAADWATFAVQLTNKELPKLAALGGDFYLPPPGAVIEKGELLANTSLPGLAIEISLNQGETWVAYTGAVPVKAGSVMLRSRLGDATSRVVTAAP